MWTQNVIQSIDCWFVPVRPFAKRRRAKRRSRVVRRQRSTPERADRIRKQSLNIKDYMQNLNIAVNDRVWPDFDVGRMSNWGMGCMPLKYFPLSWCGQNMKVYLTCWIFKNGMDEIWKLYLTYFSSHVHFLKLKHNCKWQSMTWPWPRQKVKLRKRCVLLKGLVWAKY